MTTEILEKDKWSKTKIIIIITIIIIINNNNNNNMLVSTSPD